MIQNIRIDNLRSRVLRVSRTAGIPTEGNRLIRVHVRRLISGLRVQCTGRIRNHFHKENPVAGLSSKSIVAGTGGTADISSPRRIRIAADGPIPNPKQFKKCSA